MMAHIKKSGRYWVVLNHTGRTISRHTTKARAEASGRGMMWRKRRTSRAKRGRR